MNIQPMASMSFIDDNGNMITVEYVLVTPEIAAYWLTKNITHNRNLTKSNIEDRMSDLENGSYVFNGTTVKFNSRRELIDGQHRLHAIVKTGISACMLVVKGLGDEALSTLDQERVRTVAQILDISKRKLVNAPTVVATQMIRMQGDRDLMKYTTNRAKVAELAWSERATLEPWAAWTKSLLKDSNLTISQYHSLGRNRQKRAIADAPLTALVVIMIERGADQDLVTEFFTAVVTGLVKDESMTNAVKYLRRYIQTTAPLIREGGTALPLMFRNYDTIIHVYNRWLSGQEVKQVKAHGGATGIRWIDEIRDPIVIGSAVEEWDLEDLSVYNPVS